MLHGLNLDLGKGCSHELLARSVEEAQEGRRWALTLASQAVEDAGGSTLGRVSELPLLVTEEQKQQ